MRLGERVLQTAAKRPAETAVVFRDDIVRYGELAEGIRRIAAAFLSLGLADGEKVALLLPNCPPFVLGYYGATLVDLVAVPANPLLKPAELAYIWNDASIRLVIAAPPLLPGVLAAAAETPCIKHVVATGDREVCGDVSLLEQLPGFMTLSELLALGAGALAQSPDLLDRSEANEDSCAVIIYTSGTTGHPKGAMLSHKNLHSNVEQARSFLEIKAEDVFMTVLPLFHSFSGTVCMNIPLMTGSQAVLLENFVPARVLDTIEKRGITIFSGVPAMYNALLHHVPEREYDLSSLRICISGGAPLPSTTLLAVEEKFKVPVLEGDGPTECSPATSINPLHGERRVGSVGIPLPGVKIAIFDEQDNELPDEEIGEIVVQGDNVMLGYLNQPEATAEVMTSGWYHTGDIGKKDRDGYIYILDRKKDMIITAGLNVYPREIEEVLYGHPAILECAVIGLPDAMKGEEVAAVIVKKQGAEVTGREISAFCREKLANYKVPRKVIFRDMLPRGGTGKVVKRLLKKELEMEMTSH